FGFVMDWMYADDAPRAEQRAALLSLDRALLDELLGAEGADEGTLAMLDTMLARRRGTASGTRARTADELALLLDRAADLAMDELRERVASVDEGRRGEPLAELLECGRAIGLEIPSGNATERRVVLTESFARYSAAFGDSAVATVYAGRDLSRRAAGDVVPDVLRHSSMTQSAARRELLVRFLGLAGAVSVDDILARYAFDRAWITAQLEEWTKRGRLVRGTFGDDRRTMRWCSRRLLEQARRRELAHARRQI